MKYYNKNNYIILIFLLFIFQYITLIYSSEANERHFYEVSKSLTPTTDKITDHKYQIMYGMFLVPLKMKFHRLSKKMKFLEIGLGCNMEYGPGVSVNLWKKLLGCCAEIWEAESDIECVNKYQHSEKLNGINILTGDQGNFDDLKSWVNISGGQFDVIIDDGGHHSDQILNSFQVLWNALNPGGLYFLEDLHVQTTPEYENFNVPAPVSVIQTWIEYLLVTHSSNHPSTSKYHEDLLKIYPAPKNLKWIFCQREACVLCKDGGDYLL